MTSDQLVSVRHPDNTDLSCRGMHRSTPLLNGLGHDVAGGSQPKPSLGWSANRSSSHFAPTKIHHPSSRFQIDVFFASRVLGATDGISRLFLEISVHRGHPESLNLRGHRRGETVPFIVRTKRPLNWRVSPSLETIVV